MAFGSIEWRDEFCIGVPIVDKAHKALFSIVHKILTLTRDKDDAKRQKACEEGLKYFKNYVVEHFSQEEEYMRSVKYPYYIAHKRRHDLMKNETLPELEKDLIKNEYAPEAIERFADMCVGWLTSHIMIEDQAIKSNRKINWDFERGNNVNGVHLLFDNAMRGMFKTRVELLDSEYGGGVLNDPICMQFVFANTAGKRVKAVFGFEESTVAEIIGRTLSIKEVEMGRSTMVFMKELCMSFVQRVAPFAKLMDGTYQLEIEETINADDIRKELTEEYYQYRMLMNCDFGKFAFAFTRLIIEHNDTPENNN